MNMLSRFALVTGLVGLASSAHGLTIVPTFDSSITGAPNGAAMMTAINAAIQVLQAKLTDNVTVKITFVADENIGLGQSATFGSEYSYADFRTALANHATSLNDTIALSHLPNSANDPVISGTQIHLTTAQARLLGLDTYNDTDSTVSLKMSLMNFTRPPLDLGKFDLQQVVEHEVDEVLGISSGLPDTSVVWPIDLFRYSTNAGGLSRTFTTSGDNAYFSINGTNLLARFNMDSGGDYGDCWSAFFPTNWSPITGNTLNFPQVQDAFSGPGIAFDLGVPELTALDVVGWTVVAAAPTTPPTLRIVCNGAGQATISWTNTATGFVLQERTNLVAGAWADSISGASNPAVVLTSPTQKFYRLNKAPALLRAAFAPSVLPTTPVKHKLVTRVLLPGSLERTGNRIRPRPDRKPIRLFLSQARSQRSPIRNDSIEIPEILRLAHILTAGARLLNRFNGRTKKRAPFAHGRCWFLPGGTTIRSRALLRRLRIPPLPAGEAGVRKKAPHFLTQRAGLASLAVAQTGSLPYRRLAVGKPGTAPNARILETSRNFLPPQRKRVGVTENASSHLSPSVLSARENDSPFQMNRSG